MQPKPCRSRNFGVLVDKYADEVRRGKVHDKYTALLYLKTCLSEIEWLRKRNEELRNTLINERAYRRKLCTDMK